MKAAIVNPYLDTLGGGERYTISFAKVLSKLGFTVYVQWKDPSIKKKAKERFGIDIEDFKFVEDVKRGDGYDILFWVSDGSIPALRARKNILHFQIPFNNVGGKSLMNKMKLYRINNIICNSYFTKEFIDKEYGVDSQVVYPPVDVEEIKPRKKRNTILFVGRF
jgi:glycosyltransferase involved in cell wall biosynthesis